MSSNINPIQAPLDDLFLHLNILNGLLFHLESHLENLRKLFKESIVKSNIDPSYIFAGASLVIRDLTERPENKWAVYYPSGRFFSQGEEEYLQKGNDLLCREATWTISQGYEAFETFLKDITATYVFIHREHADAEKLEKLDPMLRKELLEPTDVEYWKEFIRKAYSKNVDLLKFLRKIAPELDEVEKRNSRNIDLTEWYVVVTEVRHAATHSNMLIKSEKMRSWSQERHELLNHFFPGTYIDGNYRLEPGRKDAETNLVLFAEYAFGVFKSLSKVQHYEWNILSRQAKKATA
jgi:hypothetical protein